jgi:hypothetical protein
MRSPERGRARRELTYTGRRSGLSVRACCRDGPLTRSTSDRWRRTRAKFLLSYTVGRPTEAVDPDRLALDAARLLLSWPMVTEMIAGLRGIRPDVAT